MVKDDNGKLFVFNQEQIDKLWELEGDFANVTEGLHGGDVQEAIKLFLKEVEKAFYSQVKLTKGYENQYTKPGRKRLP